MHSVSCAAAHASVEVTLEQALPARANELGDRIRNKLQHPLIKEVRGRGAMLDMELQGAAVTAQVVARCVECGVLLGWTLHSNSLVRIAPPLTIPLPVLDDALRVILEALDL